MLKRFIDNVQQLGFINLYKRQGVGGLLREVLGNYLFDFVNRTDTHKAMNLDSVDIKGPNRLHGTAYHATHFSTLDKVFAALPVHPQESILLDLGCGKGRVMMMGLKKG